MNTTAASATSPGAMAAHVDPNARQYTVIVDMTSGNTTGCAVQFQVQTAFGNWLPYGGVITTTQIVVVQASFAQVRANVLQIGSGFVTVDITSA